MGKKKSKTLPELKRQLSDITEKMYMGAIKPRPARRIIGRLEERIRVLEDREGKKNKAC